MEGNIDKHEDNTHLNENPDKKDFTTEWNETENQSFCSDTLQYNIFDEIEEVSKRPVKHDKYMWLLLSASIVSMALIITLFIMFLF